MDNEPEANAFADGEPLQPHKEPDLCGGPSLLRSTVTFGAKQLNDLNVHKLTVNFAKTHQQFSRQ